MTAPDLIDRYCHWARSEGHSDHTVTDRRRTLAQLDEELPYGIDYASEEDLRTWLWRDRRELGSKRDWTVGTRETYHGAMSNFYHWAAEVALELEFNPAENIPRPVPPQRLPNPVTDEQLMRLLAEAREPYLTFVKIAAYTGCRCMDIANLTRERITEHGVNIIASKGGAARVVPTHPLVWEVAEDLPPGPVTDLTARQISVSGWNYFARTLRMPGVRMHRLRHWFGTQVQRQYRNLLVTQQFLGHKDPRTTAGYALVAATDTRAAIDLLPVFAVDRRAAATVAATSAQAARRSAPSGAAGPGPAAGVGGVV